MAERIVDVSAQEIEKYIARGYNEDIMPRRMEERRWRIFNYFTLWMGSVHNVPNYVAVGGFLFLGLSPLNVMIALMISSLCVTALMLLSGAAGAKYGIPFSILVKNSYGERGSLLPGIFRGLIAAIMWYGLQTYAGSQSLMILLGKLFPSYLEMGGDFSFFGISLPGLIAFVIFWILNLIIGMGSGSILSKFTALLNPLIYIVFGGMTIWGVGVAGGLGNILNYSTGASGANSALFVYLMIISSVLSVWAAPGVSASDFARNTTTYKGQALGQFLGLFVSYLLFAFSSVTILIGASIHYGTETWNVLEIISRWDSLFATSFAIFVLLMTTISTNATGNIVPAGYQLATIFKKLDFKKGVLIASIISFLIMPWKLMENSDSIYLFLNVIGAIMGPVAGVMISHYFFVNKGELNLDQLYAEPDHYNYPGGINSKALITTLVSAALVIVFMFTPSLEYLSNIAWIISFALSFAIYTSLVILKK